MSAINNSYRLNSQKNSEEKILLSSVERKIYILYKHDLEYFFKDSTEIQSVNVYLNSISFKEMALGDSPLSRKIFNLTKKTFFKLENDEFVYDLDTKLESLKTNKNLSEDERRKSIYSLILCYNKTFANVLSSEKVQLIFEEFHIENIDLNWVTNQIHDRKNIKLIELLANFIASKNPSILKNTTTILDSILAFNQQSLFVEHFCKTILIRLFSDSNKCHFFDMLESFVGKEYELHLLLVLYNDPELAKFIELSEKDDQVKFVENTLTRLIVKYLSLSRLIIEFTGSRFPVFEPVAIRILIAKTAIKHYPEQISETFLALFSENEILKNPEIEEMMIGLRDRLPLDYLNYLDKVLLYLETLKRGTSDRKDTTVLRCIGTEPGTEANWIFRLETGLDELMIGTRAHLMWQGPKSLELEVKKLFPAILFEFEIEITEYASLLGFSLEVGPSGSFFTFPAPETIEERWNQLPEETQAIIRIPKAISIEGEITPEEYSRHFQDGKIVVSTGSEYAHDMSIHYLLELIAMNSVPAETYDRANNHGIEMHRQWDRMIEWGANGGIELSKENQSYLACLTLLNGIYADTFSGSDVSTKWDIARDHSLGENIISVMTNPDWKRYGQAVFEGCDEKEVYKLYRHLKERYREAHPPL